MGHAEKKVTKAQATDQAEHLSFAINQFAMVLHLDCRGHIASINDKLAELSGYSGPELSGKSVNIFNANFHPKAFFWHIWETISKGILWSDEICCKSKDGGIFWVRTTIVPRLLKESARFEFLCFAFDITPQKTADLKLSNYSTQLGMALEIGNIGMWELDLHTHETTLHERFSKMLNVSSSVNTLEKFVAMMHPLDQKAFILQVEEFKSGKCQGIEVVTRFKILNHEGELWVHFLQKGLPSEFDDEGRAKVLMGTCIDISEMEMNRLILEEQRELIEHSDQQKRILIELLKISNMVCPFQEKLDSALAYLVRMKVWREIPKIALYFSDEDELKLMAQFPSDRSGADRNPWPEKISRKEIETIHASLKLPLHSGNRELGHLFMVEESLDSVIDLDVFGGVSEGLAQVISKTKIEMALEEEKARMVYASKMTTLGEMAGSIAHEINNPLAIILGTTMVMKGMVKKGSLTPEKIEKDIERISKTAERMANIIKGLKNFSRNADNDPIVPVELQSVLDDTLSLCQEKIKIRGVELELPQNVKQAIPCRSTHICQVLLNLIGNSLDAIENLPEKWVKISFEEDHSSFILKVTDSGKGIPDEVLEKLMTPFFTTKSQGKGTGLGLSISLKIMKGHGGSLTYNKNSPNTQFIVSLPKPLGESLKKIAV